MSIVFAAALSEKGKGCTVSIQVVNLESLYKQGRKRSGLRQVTEFSSQGCHFTASLDPMSIVSSK